MKKILYIINPISGVGKQKIIEQALEKHSNSTKVNYKIEYTTKAGDATRIANTCKTAFDGIVVVGGDGSVNETAQALINSNTAMGIIPTGSGNGFARDLKIPLRVEKAIRVINSFNTKLVDSAKINEEFFVNVAGLGFDAQIAHKFAELGTRGFKSYVKLSLKELTNIKRKQYQITIDDRTLNLEAVMLVIANGRQFGNNAYIAPKASLSDGLLNVVVVNLPKVIPFEPKSFRIIRSFRAKKISIVSNTDFVSQIDGEPADYKNNLHIEVLPLSLKVIVPN